MGTVHESINSAIPVSAYMRNLILSYDLEQLTAPIQAGQRLGTVEVWYQGSCLLETEVFAMGNVRAANNTGVTIQTGNESRRSCGGIGILLAAVACAGAYGMILRGKRRRRNPMNRRLTGK